MQYDPLFFSHRPILSDEDKAWLHRLNRIYPLARFKSDHRHFEEMVVGFVYTSAKIEGNTYDRIDTDYLLRFGVTAGGKRYSDAVMLVNLRNGFDRMIGIEPVQTLDLDYACELHKVLMRDLLPSAELDLPTPEVRQVLLEQSPGTASPLRQEHVTDDIDRLEPVLRGGLQ